MLDPETLELAERFVQAMEAQAVALDAIANAIPNGVEISQAQTDVAGSISAVADAIGQLALIQ